MIKVSAKTANGTIDELGLFCCEEELDEFLANNEHLGYVSFAVEEATDEDVLSEEELAAWEEQEALAIEAELAAERAYLEHLERPSAYEPIDEYEEALRYKGA